MELRPLPPYLVIEVHQSETTTKSGIIIAAQGKPTSICTVKGVSAGIDDIQVGDEILVDKYQPLEIAMGNESVTVISYSDVFGIIKKG